MLLVFGNFYFEYSSYRFGIELGLWFRVKFLGFIKKCLHAWNMHQTFSDKSVFKIIVKTAS